MAERHPSRTLLLVPRPDDPDGLDALLSLRCFPIGDRAVCGEVIELALRGNRASAPASIALPLLISDLPVFCRWRGQPRLGLDRVRAAERDRRPADRRLDGVAGPAGRLRTARGALRDRWSSRTSRGSARSGGVRCLPRCGRISRMSARSASRGRARKAHLLAGWLRSRLGHDVEVEIEERERLEGIDLDGQPAPFPPGPAAERERRPLGPARPLRPRPDLRSSRPRRRRVAPPTASEPRSDAAQSKLRAMYRSL